MQSKGSRTTRFLEGIGLGYTHQALVMIVGLWLPPFLLSRIGAEHYGMWLVASQWLLYLLLMDMGLYALVPRELAQTRNAGDAQVLMTRMAGLTLLQLPLVACVALAVWLLISLSSWQPVKEPLAVSLLVFVALFPCRMFAAVLEGRQELGFLARVQIFSWALGMATTVSFVFFGRGLMSLAAGWTVQQALQAVAWVWRCRTIHADVLPRWIFPLNWPMMKSDLRKSGWISIAQIATVLLSGLDVVIVGALLGPLQAVVYMSTAKLVTVLSNQPQLLVNAALPGLSELRGTGSQERLLGAASSLGVGLLLASGAVACVVAVVNRSFVTWWMGPEQFGGTLLTSLFIAVMLLRHWNLGLNCTMFCLGMERRLFLTLLTDGLVTGAAAIVGVKLIGPAGAPLGSLLGVCLVSLPANVRAVSGRLDVNVSTYLSDVLPWAWRFLLVCAGAAVLARYAYSPSFAHIAVMALISLSAYLLLMLPAAVRWPVGAYLRFGYNRFVQPILTSTSLVVARSR